MMLLAAILTISCGSPENRNAAAVQKRFIPEEQASGLITIAKKKASELGYKVEDLDHMVIREDDVIVVIFHRKSRPGILAMGGGLAVYLDEKGTVLDARKTY